MMSKKISRTREREIALQVLYSLDIKKILNLKSAKIELNKFRINNNLRDEKYYFEKLVLGVVDDIENIDKLIDTHAIDWKISRMSYIDRNILRISSYELQGDIPIAVSINEAVELGKKYGDTNTPRFINGILANLA